MSEWTWFGRLLIVVGLGIVGVGILFSLADKFPGLSSALNWIGKLPGDISFKRDSFSFYFPIATSVVLSIVVSLLFYLLSWLFRR